MAQVAKAVASGAMATHTEGLISCMGITMATPLAMTRATAKAEATVMEAVRAVLEATAKVALEATAKAMRAIAKALEATAKALEATAKVLEATAKAREATAKALEVTAKAKAMLEEVTIMEAVEAATITEAMDKAVAKAQVMRITVDMATTIMHMVPVQTNQAEDSSPRFLVDERVSDSLHQKLLS